MQTFRNSITSKTSYQSRLERRELNLFPGSLTPQLNNIIADQYEQAFQAPSIATISFENPPSPISMSKTFCISQGYRKDSLNAVMRNSLRKKIDLDKTVKGYLQAAFESPHQNPQNKHRERSLAAAKIIKSRYSQLLWAIAQNSTQNKFAVPIVQFNTIYEQHRKGQHSSLSSKQSFRRQLETIKFDRKEKKDPHRTKQKNIPSLSLELNSLRPNSKSPPISNEKRNAYQQALKNKHKLAVKYWGIKNISDLANSASQNQNCHRVCSKQHPKYKICGHQINIEKLNKLQLK